MESWNQREGGTWISLVEFGEYEKKWVILCKDVPREDFSPTDRPKLESYIDI